MADAVTQFHDVAMELVNQAIDYAKRNQYDEQTAQNINGIRITVNVLMAALQSASQVQPPPATP